MNIFDITCLGLAEPAGHGLSQKAVEIASLVRSLAQLQVKRRRRP